MGTTERMTVKLAFPHEGSRDLKPCAINSEDIPRLAGKLHNL